MLEEIEISIEEKFRGLVGEDWARRITQQVLKAEGIASPCEMSLVFTNEAYEPNKTISAESNVRTTLFLTSLTISLQ